MARTVAEMSPEERQEYYIHESRARSALSTAREKQESRAKLDELMWKGGTGSLREQVEKLKAQLAESGGGKASMTGAVKAKFQEIDERLANLEQCIDVLTGNTAVAEPLSDPESADPAVNGERCDTGWVKDVA